MQSRMYDGLNLFDVASMDPFKAINGAEACEASNALRVHRLKLQEINARDPKSREDRAERELPGVAG
jgi:hypothetical protein